MENKIRVMVFKDGEIFVAQCLEIDIAAQGTSSEDAMRRLDKVFRAELVEASAAGKRIEEIGPAPGVFNALYGSDVFEKTALVA